MSANMQKKPKGFTGKAITIDFIGPQLSRVVVIDVVDGIVTATSPVSTEDAGFITLSKAGGELTKIYQELRSKH